MKLLYPALSVLIAGAIFFWYVGPTYGDVQGLLAQEAQYDEALNRATELQSVRDQLVQRYNTFSADDITRLEKLLPDHVDNVRLILDLDSMASKYGMRVKNVSITSDQSRQDAGAIGPSDQNYESVIISFSITGTYTAFRSYLSDLEQSLRLVDVVGVNFTAADSGIFDYTIKVQTYWLKPSP